MELLVWSNKWRKYAIFITIFMINLSALFKIQCENKLWNIRLKIYWTDHEIILYDRLIFLIRHNMHDWSKNWNEID